MTKEPLKVATYQPRLCIAHCVQRVARDFIKTRADNKSSRNQTDVSVGDMGETKRSK